MRPLKTKATPSPRGFSMIELLITLAVGMLLIAMATPLVKTTIYTYRLRSAGGNYANLLQRSRMRSVTDDSYYPIYASSATFAPGINAYADLNNLVPGAYVTAPKADLGVGFSATITIQPQGAAPNTNDLQNRFMPGIALTAVQINPNTWAAAGTTVVTFGPRGLPCYLAAAPPGGICSYTWPAAPTPRPVAFETFFFNGGINSWEAVTVSPAGRIREWRYNTGTATWQPLD